MLAPLAPDAEYRRRNLGAVLFVSGCLLGALLLQLLFLLPPLAHPNPSARYAAMATGAVLAFPAVLVYMTVPRLLDRYDPEPAWALMMVFVWGALAGCGLAAPVNTVVGALAGETVATVVSAPISEEIFKGLALWAMFSLWRREFDGVIDGIIYATFVALGFAAVENVVYYSTARLESHDALTATFILRGMVTPWAHPLFTSMTGIGFGLSRESTRGALRWLGPPLGLFVAILLHGLWNGVAALSTTLRVPLALLLLPLWLLFVLAFMVMVLVLVLRRGRIIREHLQDEVLMGFLSAQELALVSSAFGQMRARFGPHGALRMQLVAAAARLALSKWHAIRALQGNNRTMSFDFIAPLRARIASLRAQMGEAPPRRP